MDEVMARLEVLETSPITQAVAEQDLKPHSKALGEVDSPATVPTQLSEDNPDHLRRSIRLNAKPRPQYKDLSSRIRWQELPSLGLNPRRCVQHRVTSYSPMA